MPLVARVPAIDCSMVLESLASRADVPLPERREVLRVPWLEMLAIVDAVVVVFLVVVFLRLKATLRYVAGGC